MEQLRLRSLLTVAGPVRRTAGHRRQKGRLLHPATGGGPGATGTIVEDYFYRCETNADPKERLGDTVVLDVR